MKIFLDVDGTLLTPYDTDNLQTIIIGELRRKLRPDAVEFIKFLQQFGEVVLCSMSDEKYVKRFANYLNEEFQLGIDRRSCMGYQSLKEGNDCGSEYLMIDDDYSIGMHKLKCLGAQGKLAIVDIYPHKLYVNEDIFKRVS